MKPWMIPHIQRYAYLHFLQILIVVIFQIGGLQFCPLILMDLTGTKMA
jgi:hypothetical protein